MQGDGAKNASLVGMDRNFSCYLKAASRHVGGQPAALRLVSLVTAALLAQACAPAPSYDGAGADLLIDGQPGVQESVGPMQTLSRVLNGLIGRSAASALKAPANVCSNDPTMEASCELAGAAIAFLAMRERHQPDALRNHAQRLQRIDNALNPGPLNGVRKKGHHNDLRRLLGEGSLAQRYWEALEAEFGLWGSADGVRSNELAADFAQAMSRNVTDLICFEAPEGRLSCSRRPTDLERSVIHAQTVLETLTPARRLAAAMLELLIAELDAARVALLSADPALAPAAAGTPFPTLPKGFKLDETKQAQAVRDQADVRLGKTEACFTLELLKAPRGGSTDTAPRLASHFVGHLHSLDRNRHQACSAAPWLLYAFRSLGLLVERFGKDGVCNTICMADLHQGEFLRDFLAALLWQLNRDPGLQRCLTRALSARARVRGGHSQDGGDPEATHDLIHSAVDFLKNDFLKHGCSEPTPAH